MNGGIAFGAGAIKKPFGVSAIEAILVPTIGALGGDGDSAISVKAELLSDDAVVFSAITR